MEGAAGPLEQGQARYLIAAGLDVTVRRGHGEELRRRAQELAEAVRHKDEFLAILAHELRNPLTPILANLRILRLPDVAPDVAAEARAACTGNWTT